MKIAAAAGSSSNPDRLATIWAIIEARQTFPAMIVVAGATDSDDTGPVARGLSGVASEAGKRTGYLYLGSDPPRIAASDSLSYAQLTLSGRQSKREGFDSWLKIWRATYDVIVVDLPRLDTCSLGAHAARLSDGIVVALFPDRQVTSADRELTKLFAQLGASIIGVVKTPAVVNKRDVPTLKSRSFSSLFFPVRQQ